MLESDDALVWDIFLKHRDRFFSGKVLYLRRGIRYAEAFEFMVAHRAMFPETIVLQFH